jgi:hypothetical protein
MASDLQYFAYVSRAKVRQLHEQITDLGVTQRSVTRNQEGTATANVGSDTLLGIIKAGFSLGTRRSLVVQEVGQQTVVQQLQAVVSHIHRHERVLDLAKICREEAGTALDAFAYIYSGEFFSLGSLGRDSGGIYISGDSLGRGPDEIVLSKQLLIQPGRQENALKETGPNNGALVSDIAIIHSFVGNYTISLACSLKYFADMGGSWDDQKREWDVQPHSGNHHFFSGESGMFATALIFITGVRDRTIMGTPLFLAHASNPNHSI